VVDHLMHHHHSIQNRDGQQNIFLLCGVTHIGVFAGAKLTLLTQLFPNSFPSLNECTKIRNNIFDDLFIDFLPWNDCFWWCYGAG